MDLETTDVETLRSTLDELAHLLIDPIRLTVHHDSELGRGGFGNVCLAVLDGSVKVAVKQLRVDIICPQGMRVRVAKRLARELKVWEKAKHPNVLQLIGYYLSENYGCAQIVSPHMANGNVTEYIKRSQAGIEVRLKFVRGITLRLEYLHTCSPPICHGDLKPVNVLINDEPDAVLCDFGLAAFVQGSGAASGLTTSQSVKGTYRYMSPELVRGDKVRHDLESDVWGWGCTAFEIITDCIPYSAALHEPRVILAVTQGDLPGPMELLPTVDMPYRPTLEALRQIIPNCWNKDPTQRPSAPRLREHLNCVSPEEEVDPPPRRPPEPEPSDSSQPANQPDQTERRQAKLTPRPIGTGVTHNVPNLETVLFLDERGAANDICFSPNGEWVATRDNKGRSWISTLKRGSTPQVIFENAYDGGFRWSPDSRYLCRFGSKGLRVWSAESQTTQYCLSESVDSVTWLSSGEDLVPWSMQRISTMSSKSGRFQLESAWIPVSLNMDAIDMTSIPMDSVGGRRIIVILGKILDAKFTGIIGGLRVVRETVSPYLGNGESRYFILVYDTDAQEVLARAACGGGSPQTITISRNGEFALMSYDYKNPALWRLVPPGSNTESWDIQCVHEYLSGVGSWTTSAYNRACFGGDNDEWVISATWAGVLYIWEKQFSHPCQVIEGLHKSFPSTPVAIYCPANGKRSTPRLLCGHTDNGEVVIWEWWRKSSE